jgi:predicted TIM-barrel fold metal-dependent hydrolase
MGALAICCTPGATDSVAASQARNREIKMLDEHLTFENANAGDAGLIIDREAEKFDSLNLPKGLTVVSADNHIELTEDIFYERFPARLRDKAPRVWFDKYWRVGFKGEMEAYNVSGSRNPIADSIDDALIRTVLNDGFQSQVRYQHLDAEGIKKEIVYPQSLMAFVRYPDQEVQELMYRTYNEYIAELDRKHRGRFFGVGICSNWTNPDKAESAIQQIVDLGLKSFIIPFNPGKADDGRTMEYSDEELDRFWSVAEEAGLPINFHIGEIPSNGGRGGFGTFFMLQAAPFRRALGSLIFGGVLDRHPKLRFVFAEGGINWVAGALQDAELGYGSQRAVYDIMPKHRPSYYWHNHCYATFQTDTIGLKLIDYLGADRIMWAQDYPHSEGTFGYSSKAMKEILDMTSEADARKILGDNATAVYKL